MKNKIRVKKKNNLKNETNDNLIGILNNKLKVIGKNIDVKNSLASILFFPISIFYLELVFRFFGLKQGINITILYLLLYSCILGLAFYFVCTLFNEKINRKILIALTFLLCFMVSVQFIYYKMFYTPMILYSLTGATQVAEFSDMAIEMILKNLFYLILLFVPFILTLFKKIKIVKFRKTNVYFKLMIVFVVIFLNFTMFTTLAIGGKDINSNYDIYYGDNVPDLVINRFGIIRLVHKDLGNIIFKNTNKGNNLDLSKYLNDEKDKLKEDLDDIIQFEDDNEDSKSDKDFEGPGDIGKAIEGEVIETPEVYDTRPNIFEIDFDGLIEKETDQNIIAMHKYFSSVEPTKKNKFTGIFEGYNLIMITAEAFSHLALDKDLTPTLYKMANESFVFNNFYTPIWGVSTSDGEYVACQSLIPKSGIWSFHASGENYLPFVMGNQFSKLGYSTYAYHNHYYDYYRRDVSHPNMGYDYKGVRKGLEIKDTWPESDLEMIEVTVPEYINDEKFHAYYMTVSGHKNYTFYGNYIAGKNKELVEHLDASEPVKAYYACNIELDKAMESLIKQLEEKGVLDKTVIAISADHYPYGLEKEEIDEIAGHKVEENFELYKNAFILWAKDRETVVIDKPCSSLDIIPTLSNLFGLEYDSRLLMGRDMLSDADPLVIFSNRSFITDKAMYNSKTKEVINLSDAPLEEDYIKEMNRVVSAKFAFSAEILDRDYYSIIFRNDK